MLIDWFTVAAQLFNFLLLVWLLKRYLYQPILQALDAREQKIAAELAYADNQKQHALLQQAEFVKKNQEFDAQRAELLKQAVAAANAERERLLNQVRTEAEAARLQQQTALSNEQQSLQAEIAQRIQEEVFAIARKTLLDLAAVNLEQQIIMKFIDKIQAVTVEQKETLLLAFKNSNTPLIIRTSLTLSSTQTAEIEKAVKQSLGVDGQLQFETSSALISGIELSGNGQKIAWSIADYLAELEKNNLSTQAK